MADTRDLRAQIDLVEYISRTVSLKQSGSEWKGRCPLHDDSTASLSVNPAKRLWHCFGCGKGGDIIAWVKETQKVDFAGAKSILDGGMTIPSKETVWEIVDATGNVVAQHARIDSSSGKRYVWRQPDGKIGLSGVRVETFPLYGLPKLLEAPSDIDIFVVEGEKCADALRQYGYCALGTVTGASSCPAESAFHPLVGRTGKVYLWPDNDGPGYSHMEKVANLLTALEIQPYLIRWEGAPAKGDAYDYLQTHDNVLGLTEIAARWSTDKVTLGPLLDKSIEQKNSSEAKRCKNVAESVAGTRNGGGKSVAKSLEADRCKNVAESVAQEKQSSRVLEWVKGTTGWWATEELDKDLSISGLQAKTYRRSILFRLKEQGIIESHPKINRQFRFINTRLISLAFKTASNVGVLPIKWPLGIEKYVHLFPGNMAVVAGSPNAGKTAFILNFIYLNQGAFPVYYFCSEMGAVELRDRLDKFAGMAIEDWKFEAIERASDFADVIRPDCVNIVDFLEMTADLYMINTHLTAISHKLGSGIAIVAVQKKLDAKYGRGQEFGLEKPKLYLSMDKGKLVIVKGKSWATKNVDPNGLQVNFKIIDGCQFQATNEWDWAKP